MECSVGGEVWDWLKVIFLLWGVWGSFFLVVGVGVGLYGFVYMGC